jgi:Fe-Mn family superoxide dismutase
MKKMKKNSRREFITKGAMAAAATVGFLSFSSTNSFSIGREEGSLLLPADEGPFKLPPLPYSYDALEPYIDAKTMEIHYTKHHQAYIDKLNAAVEKSPELKGKSVQELVSMIDKAPEAVKVQIRNQGGGHWNHSFFWQILAPKSDVAPAGKLKDAMISQWQTMDAFKEEFNKAGLGVFGSGWVWLIADKSGKLSITTTPNQDNTLMDISKDKGKPILGVDVWEHAYYLKHQNKRAEYLTDIWNVINWKKAMEIYG